VHEQRTRQCSHKIYSLHAPEADYIAKGKPHRPYGFGEKVSVAPPLYRCKSGQFVALGTALLGYTYDGSAPETVVPAIIKHTGGSPARFITDACYWGHRAPKTSGISIFSIGQT
jgi:transposase, IS5 family